MIRMNCLIEFVLQQYRQYVSIVFQLENLHSFTADNFQFRSCSFLVEIANHPRGVLPNKEVGGV